MHPATVHFPISFTFLTGGLDALYFASTFPATAGIVASTCRSASAAYCLFNPTIPCNQVYLHDLSS